jgi:hypothetical protein
MLVLLRSVYECVSIFLAGGAGEDFAMEEAFLLLLHAEKAEMAIFVHLSPHLECPTHFMFMAEL